MIFYFLASFVCCIFTFLAANKSVQLSLKFLSNRFNTKNCMPMATKLHACAISTNSEQDNTKHSLENVNGHAHEQKHNVIQHIIRHIEVNERVTPPVERRIRANSDHTAIV